MQMTGNTILITGGLQGIGFVLAVALQQVGNQVIMAGLRQPLLAQAVSAHHSLQAEVLDVTDIAGLAGFSTRMVAKYPSLNVLINNAGIMQAEDLLAPAPSVAETAITANLIAPIRLTASFLPHLRNGSEATVIIVTPGLAFVPIAFTPTYSDTKAGLHSYAQSLRHQLRDTSVQVIALLATLPASGELLVERVKLLRGAEASGRYDKAFAVLNGR